MCSLRKNWKWALFKSPGRVRNLHSGRLEYKANEISTLCKILANLLLTSLRKYHCWTICALTCYTDTGDVEQAAKTDSTLKFNTDLNFWLGSQQEKQEKQEKTYFTIKSIGHCGHHYCIYSLNLLSRPFLCFLFSSLHRSFLLSKYSLNLPKRSITVSCRSNLAQLSVITSQYVKPILWITLRCLHTSHWLLFLKSSQGGKLPKKSPTSSKTLQYGFRTVATHHVFMWFHLLCSYSAYNWLAIPKGAVCVWD